MAQSTEILPNGLQLLQDDRFFKLGQDSVLLSAFAKPRRNAKLLDLGCGSGILGIGALLLGCAHVTGCDIDPKAPEVAAANAALNGFYDDKFTVCAGDILADAGLRRRLGTGYDIVLANIVASSSRWPRSPRRFSPRAARSCARASSTGARTRWPPRSRARASPSRRTTRSRSGTASRLRWREAASLGSLV